MVRRVALSAVLVLVAALLSALAPSAAPAAPSSRNAAALGGPAPSRTPASAAPSAPRRWPRPAVTRRPSPSPSAWARPRAWSRRSVERDVDGTEHVRYDRTARRPARRGRRPGRAREGVRRDGRCRLRRERPDLGGPHRPPARGRQDGDGGRPAAGRAWPTARVGGAELVVWAVSGQPRLAWQVDVRGVDRSGAPVKRVEYVDAVSGDHIAGWSELHYATATGSGRSLYSGKVSLVTVKKGTGKKRKFLLKDPKRGNSDDRRRAEQVRPEPDQVHRRQAVHRQGQQVGQRQAVEPAERRRRRRLRLRQDLGLLQDTLRPAGHPRRRQRRHEPGPLRQELRQRRSGTTTASA